MPPVFLAPGFNFSVVTSVCVAHTVDLRPDRTLALHLSDHIAASKPGPVTGLLGLERGVKHETADEYIARDLESGNLRLHAGACGPISVTSTDIQSASSEWMAHVDMGQTRWLLVPALERIVENPRLQAIREPKAAINLGSGNYVAVVSGYLFERQGTGGRLVWRDTVLGSFYTDRTSLGTLKGPTDSVRATAAEESISLAFGILLNVDHVGTLKQHYRWQSPHHPWQAHTQNFGGNCQVVWSALKDVLKGYEMVELDENEMLAIYSLGWARHRSGGEGLRVHKALVRPAPEGCALQITEAAGPDSGQDKDAISVLASVEKQIQSK